MEELICRVRRQLAQTGKAYQSRRHFSRKPGRFTDNPIYRQLGQRFPQLPGQSVIALLLLQFPAKHPFGASGLQASLGSAASGTDLNFPYQLPVNDRVLTLDETYVFSNKLINDFRFGYIRINNSALNINPVTVSDAGVAGELLFRP